MNIKLALTLLLTKLVIKACRFTRRGGTTLPGKIARKLNPGILKELTKNIKIVAVTGTNGKTTTSRIIAQIFKENRIEFITNKSGANLVSGITTTFVENTSITGVIRKQTALLEVDEAAFKVLSDFVEPEILVVTNFFRDQLDRYGELYTTLNGVRTGISKLKNTKLVLNADDSLCASLGKDTDKPVTYFGIANEAYSTTEEVINTDAMFCIFCKSKYEYSNHIFGHLGDFHCPECGYSRPETDITCTGADELTSSYSEITYSVKESSEIFHARVNLPGLYNVYNALAAAACGQLLDLPVEKTIHALGSFECGFGRMETILTEGKFIKVILVKNPTGFNQVLSYLLTEEKNCRVAFLINDRLADGTDISWLWDVDFEKLDKIQDKLEKTFTSGDRAEDMAVRLKYAGIYTSKIDVVKNYEELIKSGLEGLQTGSSFYILPTYTALLDIRKILKKKFRLKDFWR